MVRRATRHLIMTELLINNMNIMKIVVVIMRVTYVKSASNRRDRVTARYEKGCMIATFKGSVYGC